MMCLLAVAIFGVDFWNAARLPDSVRTVGPVLTVFGLTLLIIGLLALALVDVIATVRYARRQRRELAPNTPRSCSM